MVFENKYSNLSYTFATQMQNVIYTEGVIGEDVTVGTVRSQYEALSNPKEITVKINSGGGDVDEGFAIYDFLTTLGIKVNTEVLGMCGSIATIIQQSACNGGERTIHQNSKDFIHNPYWQNNAPIPMEARDAKDLYERLMLTESKILDFYVKHTSKEAAMIKAKMDAQTELTAQEALDLNLVDRIITTEVQSLRAYKVIALIKNETQKPNTMSELKEEIKTGFSKVEKLIAAFLKKPILNMTVKTTEGVDIYFEGELMEGSKVFADEAMTKEAPNGVHTYEGKLYTVTDGVVTKVEEITSAQTELEVANAKIAELQATIAAKDTEVINAKAEVTTAQAKAAEIETTFINLKNQIVSGGKEIFNAAPTDKGKSKEDNLSPMAKVVALRKEGEAANKK